MALALTQGAIQGRSANLSYPFLCLPRLCRLIDNHALGSSSRTPSSHQAQLINLITPPTEDTLEQYELWTEKCIEEAKRCIRPKAPRQQ